MTSDSIPQQAGPGAGADDVFWLYELTKGEGVYQGCRGPKAEWIMRQTVSGIEDAGEPFPVYLAAPLAVEDSRERCASEDAKDAARYRWLCEHHATLQEGDHQNPPLAQIAFNHYSLGVIGPGPSIDECVDAAMAAASSGDTKEKSNG